MLDQKDLEAIGKLLQPVNNRLDGIDNRLNGEGIIARPLDVDCHMRIIMIRKKNQLLSRYAKSYIQAIEQHMSIG